MTAPADAAADEETTEVIWTAAPMGDAAYRRLLRLLFAPADDDRTGGDADD
ncbi:hypothetical protein FHX37_0622 [Haloactinospora alba]|uniref:Uncharacterized protein n=1 Tax=Haloactinospora alba TaxID=405555 RepID=A0A543NG46_9ACTN|nr:hypothetical protein [Haloactinospora alba]TQN30740.1 hypothetical protein FHX37_0622 [Haloactinospora alba]